MFILYEMFLRLFNFLSLYLVMSRMREMVMFFYYFVVILLDKFVLLFILIGFLIYFIIISIYR